MTISGRAQIVIFIVVLTALTPLLGAYMASVYQGRRVFLSPLAAPLEPIAGNAGSHGIALADIGGGLVMLLGRFVPILAVLALSGALATRRTTPAGLGTLRTDTPTFVIFLVGFVIIFALLNFLAALFLGPLAQTLSSQLF